MARMGAIYPSRVGAACIGHECKWTKLYETVDAEDHNTGQRRWTAAQAKVRRAAQGHADTTGHVVSIYRSHAQNVYPGGKVAR